MQRLSRAVTLFAYFFSGAIITAFFLASLAYLFASLRFRNRIYPGVKIAGQDVSLLTEVAAEKLFNAKYPQISGITVSLSSPLASASVTARELDLRPDSKLMAQRAYSIGRQTKNPYYNFLQILAADKGQIDLPIEVNFDRKVLDQTLDALAPKIEKSPIDAIFQFIAGSGPDGKGRVQAFQPSADGLQIDRDATSNLITSHAKSELSGEFLPSTWTIALPIKRVPPVIRSSTADELGIKTLLGEGASYFYDSIPGRVFNIGLGTEKINGSLISPGETFSFDTAIGTVSAVFGFQKAYSIKEGKTVLDDGGGVCQVSTTLYRAVLNSGLPVIDRTAHTYRVGFYEQGGFPPGLDATVYPPSPDFKFRNDTGGWILIQANFDRANAKLTFDLFGTNDGRKTEISGPFITSTSPPPDPIYEDDPTKPVGTTTQVDTAHWGATTYFTRKVTRLGETLINEVVRSDYIPWPARYLRGTKTS